MKEGGRRVRLSAGEGAAGDLRSTSFKAGQRADDSPSICSVSGAGRTRWSTGGGGVEAVREREGEAKRGHSVWGSQKAGAARVAGHSRTRARAWVPQWRASGRSGDAGIGGSFAVRSRSSIYLLSFACRRATRDVLFGRDCEGLACTQSRHSVANCVLPAGAADTNGICS